MTENAASSQEWEIDNLPNRLTIFRVILIPIIIVSLMLCLPTINWVSPELKRMLGWLAAFVFIMAAITDFLDGHIARKRNIVTVFGSFLDPIADKFLVVSSLIILQGLDRVPVIIVIILVLREMYITALRLLALEKELTVPVSSLGKWKTAGQMISIPLLMANDTPFNIPLPLIGTIFIYIASLFSLYSAIQYTIGLFAKIQAKRKRIKEAKKQKKEEGHSYDKQSKI